MLLGQADSFRDLTTNFNFLNYRADVMLLKEQSHNISDTWS